MLLFVIGLSLYYQSSTINPVFSFYSSNSLTLYFLIEFSFTSSIHKFDHDINWLFVALESIFIFIASIHIIYQLFKSNRYLLRKYEAEYSYY